MLRATILSCCVALSLAGSARPPAHSSVLWAWQRAEDVRFAGPAVDVAILAGTVTLFGAEAVAVPRLQPARLDPLQRRLATVHVEIDRTRRLLWTAYQRQRAAAAVVAMGAGYDRLQVDFEVRQSERAVLIDLLRDVRAGWPGPLSMTALASWCDTERWLGEAPVDEVVPMLFRMGPGGAALRARLSAGGDFGDPHCRTAIGLAVDSPPQHLPPGRRLFLFDPHAWQPADLAGMQRILE